MKIFLNSNRSALLLTLTFCVLWGLTVLFINAQIYRSYAKSVLGHAISQLRQDLSMPEYKPIARSLKDLEDLGFLLCPKLIKHAPQKVVLADSSLDELCFEKNSSDLHSFRFEGVDGSQLELITLIAMPLIYKVSFVGLFFLGLAFFLMLVSFFIARERLIDKIRIIEISTSNKMATMAAQLAHDIRAPAGALITLKSRLEAHDSTSAELAQSIVERIQRIADSLLENYKSSSVKTSSGPFIQPAILHKTEAQNGRPRFNYSLKRAINQIMREKELSVKLTKIRLSYFMDGPDINDHLVSKSDIQRIISNLINNSTEAIEDRGFVTLEVVIHDDFYTVTIRDNGCGMSEVQKASALSGRSTKIDGFGIGLASSRALIESLGGRFTIESNLGYGTKVEIELPYPNRNRTAVSACTSL